jgi:small subunit ribosomal protein S16
MAVAIRLRRDGAKNKPYYRIVVADKQSPRDGKFIELIGTYDPRKKINNSGVKLDRADYWMSHGAQPSDTVLSIIKKARNNAEKAAADAKKAEAAKPAEPAKTEAVTA